MFILSFFLCYTIICNAAAPEPHDAKSDKTRMRILEQRITTLEHVCADLFTLLQNSQQSEKKLSNEVHILSENHKNLSNQWLDKYKKIKKKITLLKTDLRETKRGMLLHNQQCDDILENIEGQAQEMIDTLRASKTELRNSF